MRDYASCLPVALDFDLRCAGWDGSTEPYPGVSARTYAIQTLRRTLLKKFTRVGANKEADEAALRLFVKNNAACASFTLDESSMHSWEAEAIGEAKNFIYNFFYPHDSQGDAILTYWKIVEGFGLGNGANIGSPGTDFLSKVGLSNLSATSQELHDLFVGAIASDRLWSDVESIRSKRLGRAVVKGSRVSFVPKTTEISRTICTEPVLNMLFQKGIGSVIERQLAHACGISMTTQPDKNRILARIGSRNGRFGTIDLSSASDTISLSLVRRMFPAGVVSWLEKTRCAVTTLPGGEEMELHMVSSMGNAFTFPLQTLLFTSLVYGAYRMLGIRMSYPFRQSLGNFAVFGDDIIVDSRAYNLVVRLLCLCGFSVNVDKSFNDGFFRESCGRDYLSGHNVRGVYLKHLHDVCDVYSAINRLNVWSARHSVALPFTIQTLLRGTRKLLVPPEAMDTEGIWVPEDMAPPRSYSRHRYYGAAFRYKYLRIVTKRVDMTDVERRTPELKGWFPNHPAVLLSAIAGTLRDGSVVPRSSQRLTRISYRVTPRWGTPDAWPEVIPAFGRRWKLFVEANLTVY